MIVPLTLAALAVTSTSFPGAPLGEEAFGSSPVRENEEWAKGVVTVANDTHRVYWRWVNGNEDFCFEGDAAAVNAALAAFASIEADVAEVVLMPTAGQTKSFERKDVAYDWRLYAPSGIVLAMARDEGYGGLYPTHATLTVHVTGKAFALGDLEWPAGVRLLGPHDLLRRYQAALEGEKEHQRASAVALLGELSFLPEAIEAITGALGDESVSVRTTAARVLQGTGARGRSAAPRLRSLVGETTDPDERADYQRAIEGVKAASKTDRGEAELQRRAKAQRELLDGRKVELELRRDGEENGRPRFVAALVNRGTLPVLVVQPGDGSEVGWRTPHVRWVVRDAATEEIVEPPGVARCGNMNTVTLEEMVALAPGERCELSAWLGAPHLPASGTYEVSLRYDNIPTEELRGLSGPHPSDAVRLMRRSTPLSLESAPVEVSVE